MRGCLLACCCLRRGGEDVGIDLTGWGSPPACVWCSSVTLLLLFLRLGLLLLLRLRWQLGFLDDADLGSAEDATAEVEAGLQDLADGARFRVRVVVFEEGLVLARIEGVADLAEFTDALVPKGLEELGPRHLDALQQFLQGRRFFAGRLDGVAEVIRHVQEGLGERLDRVLPRVRHVPPRDRPGVLRLGQGPHHLLAVVVPFQQRRL
mmetsp:Transcript_13847/g.45170  ORF Transcript_13847/g.45170 Transcript_13847/m.45170 type:complete len:207 (-) Transcript_13847:358-978(-)